MMGDTMKKTLKTLLAATAIAGLTTGAFAHRIWILPSTFTLSGETERVTVDGAISNDLFFPNHVAMNLAGISVTAPDGSAVELLNGKRGEIRSTFDLKLNQQGTYKIAENAKTYFARWTEDGEEKRARDSLAGLLARGLADKEDAKFMVAERRVETFVTLGAPSENIFTPSGEGIELAKSTHPNDVYVGEDIRFTFTLDGKPAANLELIILKGNDRYRDTQSEMKIKTDETGTATFQIEEAGRYWMSLHTVAGTRKEGDITLARRTSYTATFEALNN